MRRRGRSLSGRWRSTRRCSAPNIPTSRRASTTSPRCSWIRAISPGRGRSMGGRWRSKRRCSAPSIPIRREPQQPRGSVTKDRGGKRGRAAVREGDCHWRKCAWPGASAHPVLRSNVRAPAARYGAPRRGPDLPEPRSRYMRHQTARTTLGPRTPPASPPMGSTRSAAPARRRRCALASVSKETLARRRDIPCQAWIGASAL